MYKENELHLAYFVRGMEKGVCLHRYRGAVSISAKNGHEESLKNNNTEKRTGHNKMFEDTTKKKNQTINVAQLRSNPA